MIKVYDALMGSGKTTYMINYMKIIHLKMLVVYMSVIMILMIFFYRIVIMTGQ